MIDLKKFSLENKTALVTGGAGLLGTQHVAALLESGAKVFLADINEDQARAATDRLATEWKTDRVVSLKLDVTCETSLQAAKAAILSGGDRLDILINNAAIDAKVSAQGNVGLEASRFENFPLARWQKELEVGLTGAFLTSQILGTLIAQGGGGAILNIASDLSVIAPDQRLYRQPDRSEEMQPVKPVTYSVIKTALVGLTRYLAAYWADKKVRVNALSPGGVFTSQPEEFVARLSSLIPLGRMAKADEYRSAIQFLCSDASSYLTGQNIVIDGGRSIL